MFKADRRSKQVQLCDLSRTIKCLLVLAVFAFGILVPVTVLNAQGDESGATVISQPTQILADILLNGLDEHPRERPSLCIKGLAALMALPLQKCYWLKSIDRGQLQN